MCYRNIIAEARDFGENLHAPFVSCTILKLWEKMFFVIKWSRFLKEGVNIKHKYVISLARHLGENILTLFVSCFIFKLWENCFLI
jgi:hypothetical protein